MSIIKHIKRIDWLLMLGVFILLGFGFASLYSIATASNDYSFLYKQIIFAVISLLLMFGVSVFDWKVLKNHSVLILFFYLICILSLAGLFIFAVKIRGVVSWYDFKYFSFNPTELTKIVLIVLLAKYFSVRHAHMYNFTHILISGVYVLIPCALIFFQPDFGSILIIIALWVGILLVSGIKLKHLLILLGTGIVVFAISWVFLLKPYQKERITTFLNPEVNTLDEGWNQAQSEIAVGSGGVYGKGIGKGSQVQLGFLPESKTDFIFAAIAEETGFVGVFFLLLGILIVVWRALRIAMKSRDNFSKFFAVGFVIVFFVQSFINIAMNLKAFPIVGIPLPLVSYGGSNLVFTFITIGIIQGLKSNELT